MSESSREVVVVGAGIVGLCVAHQLVSAGAKVRLLDPEAPGSQCSYGNSGALSAGSVAPLAMPGVLRSSLPLLTDPNGPLFVPVSYWSKAAPWLWQFVRSASLERVAEIARSLQSLLGTSVELHQAIARDIGCDDLIRTNGQLHLYPGEELLAADAGGWRLKAEHGLQMEKVDAAAIHELEPAVRHDVYRTGYFLPREAAVTSPLAYSHAIASALRERGAIFEQTRVLSLHPKADGWHVRCSGHELHASQVVVCAGAWSAELLRPLRLKVPLQSQRGYHLHYPDLKEILNRIVVLADRKVFINPMRDGLRVGGTVEIDSLVAPPRMQRAAQMSAHLAAGVHLPASPGEPARWMGHRPCMPDSMPVLGGVPDMRGLWCAFGHGHLGLTGAPQSALWLRQCIMAQDTPPEIKAFSIQRFQPARA